MRMAYGYQYLYGQEEKAIPYARRWAELDPEDENASAVIQECKAEIRKRQRSRKKKAKFVPGDTPLRGLRPHQLLGRQYVCAERVCQRSAFR